MKISQTKVGSILTFFSLFLGYGLTVVSTPIILRLIGQDEFGLFNLITSLISFLGILHFGFGSSYIRYFLKFKHINDNSGIAQLNGIFLIIFSIMGLIGTVLGFIMFFNLSSILGDQLSFNQIEKARTLLLISILNLSISFPGMVFTTYIIANEKFVFQKIVQIIKVILNPILSILFLMIGFESISLILSTLILTLIIEIIHIIYSTRFLRISFSFKNFNFIFFKDLFVFSSYLFINLLTDQINWNIDKYIIGLFHGTGSVAVYSLAGQLVLYYIAISTAISSVFIPRVHKLVNMNNEIELSYLFLKIGRIQFIVLSYILTGIIFFGKEFIVLWAGENYLDSYNVLLLLIIPLTIPLIQNIGLEIQRAKNMHKFRSILFILIAIINIGISIPLTKEYGVIGATFGTSLSLLIGNGILINLYNYTKVKIDILNFWRQILSFAPGLFIVFLFSFIIKHFVLITNFSDLFISASVYSVIFLIAFWYLGFNTFEKALLIKPLKYFFKV